MHEEHRFLVDCGEGTQRQILQSGLGFKRLDKVLLTHGHLDHILGLGGLASTFSRWEAIDQIDIYGGSWTLARVKDLLFKVVLRAEKLPLNINFVPLKPGLIFEDKTFLVSAFPVTHRGADCFGFVFQEKSRRPFLNEQAKALGVPIGPERSHLVAGKSITLADGRVIQPDDVLGVEIPRRGASRRCSSRALRG
jgi:ribonuclease Z